MTREGREERGRRGEERGNRQVEANRGRGRGERGEERGSRQAGVRRGRERGERQEWRRSGGEEGKG